MGLEIGADDYLPKPFEPRELILRLANILKRRTAGRRRPRRSATRRSRFGPFTFRLDRGELRRDDEIDPHHRARARDPDHPGASAPAPTCAREELAGSGGVADERTVDVQINRLRRKIEVDPANPALPADGAGRRLPPRGRLSAMAATGLLQRTATRLAALPPPGAGSGGCVAAHRRRAAEGPLRPLADHHHRAGGAAAIGDRLRLHGAALAARDAAPVGGRHAGHRGADRHLRELSAGQGRRDPDPHRGRAARPRRRHPARRRAARRRARSRSSRSSTRRSRDEIRRQIGRPFWIDTVGRSNLIEIRVQLDDGRACASLARRSQAYASNSHIFLVWMVGTSLVLLGVAILFLRNQIRPILQARRGGRELRQGPRDRVPAARRPRGAPGRPRLHRDEAAHRARDGAAHDDAERRQPRPAHHPDPLQALARPRRADAGGRGPEARRRRDEPHAGGLSRLRARRCRRAGRADRPARAAGGAAGRRRAPRARHASVDDRRRSDRRPCGPTPSGAACSTSSSNAARHGDRIAISADHETALAHRSTSTTTARASRPTSARRCSSPSCGSTRRATRTRAAPASASPSPATSPARMAATSACTTARSAACAPRCGCRPDPG